MNLFKQLASEILNIITKKLEVYLIKSHEDELIDEVATYLEEFLQLVRR